MKPALLAVLTAAAAASGCVEPVELDPAPCPCAPGWTCCASGNVCVREGALCDAGDGGTGTDAGAEVGIALEVEVVSSAAGGVGPDPLLDVSQLRFRLLDDQRAKLAERLEGVSVDQSRFPAAPGGRHVTAEVAGLGSSGAVLSYGSTPPLLLPAVVGSQVRVKVLLRPVEKFSPVVAGNDPNSRMRLSTPRAGHTATLLDDGRVLIAGGFEGLGPDPLTWLYKESVEIFDPATGTVSSGSPAMNKQGLVTPRAFHTAVRLLSGKVLIAGGEVGVVPPTGPRYLSNVFSGLVFDATVDDGKGGWGSVAMKRKRSRHAAAIEKTGRVLLFGGIEWTSTGAATFPGQFEWFDPEVNLFKVPTTPESPSNTRVGHMALPVLGDQFIAIAGGAQSGGPDPTNPSKGFPAKLSDVEAVKFFQYRDNVVQPLANGSIDLSPRSWSSVAMLGDSRFLVIGGYKGFDPARFYDLAPTEPWGGTDIITLKPKVLRTDGPRLEVARGHLCSVGLRDGRVLAIGGRGSTAAGLGSVVTASVFRDTSFSDGGGELVVKAERDDGGPLMEARYLHTCTLLADGSVLVAGGVAESAAGFSTLSSLELWVPRPAAD